MTRMWKIMVGVGAMALAATAASAAYAQAASGKDQATPGGFNWEIKDGKRVPKGNKQVNADGSWREEISRSPMQKGPRRRRRRPFETVRARRISPGEP